jgi:WhiB family redox-sensing transcriptional regulator
MSAASYDQYYFRAPGAPQGDEDWMERAACRGMETELFFPNGETGEALDQTEEAKAICRTCPVQSACLEYALATRQPYGVWGGATEAERRSIRRRRREAERRRRAS